MFSFLIILHTLGIIHGSSSIPPLTSGIINVTSSEEPTVLLLKQYGSKGSHYADHICSAILVESRTILTAAHCLDNEATSTSVIYGCFDTRDPSCIEVPVIGWIKHIYYVDPVSSSLNSQWNDVAVGRLYHDLSEDYFRRVYCIPGPLMGDATLIGWGRDDSDDAVLIQQSIVLPINFQFDYSGEKIFIDHNIESFSGGFCGGPLLIRDTIYGIASAPREVETGHEVLVYMDACYHKLFIEVWISLVNRYVV